MTRNKLYPTVLIACSAGFLYLAYKYLAQPKETISVCLFKNITGYTCPSCGTTKSIMLLLKGNIIESILINPFGILVFLIMFLFPLWITKDIILNQNTFFLRYKKTEKQIQNPWIFSALVLVVILNWIWNLSKHL